MSSKSSRPVFALLLLAAFVFPQTTFARVVPQRREVKVYLVALDDDGRSGKKIGCGDSLVAVTRPVGRLRATLRGAIQELLLVPHEYDARLKNFWRGRNLRVRSVSVNRGGVATIHIAGAGPQVAGVCDQPRIESQIEETAKQFPNVRRVRVFVNGRTLASAIR
jgi:Sporulation and spore germination